MNGNGRTYWKSLAELAEEPEAQKFLEREFPEGASEPPEGVTRREIMMLLGASLSMAGLAACRRPEEHIVPYVTAPEEMIPGIPQQFATTMPFGNTAFGLVVESHEGRPTKIEGNELHPSTAGSSSAWIQASILNLYDPDRSRFVRQGAEKRLWADFVEEWIRLEETRVNDGSGIAFLVEPSSSPTTARLAARVRSRFPSALWAAWAPVSDENVYAGVEMATGRPLQPVYHFDRARVVLSLDADFLQQDGDTVRQAREFADGRRVLGPDDSMSRLYCVEGPLSLTGANADHRLSLRSSEIGAFLSALSKKLGRPGSGSAASNVAPFVNAVAADLLRNRGAGLIVAGRNQPPEVHAAVAGLNAVLDNTGSTVTYHTAEYAARSRTAELSTLVDAMNAGTIDMLVILGGNPVYDAPADLDFSGAKFSGCQFPFVFSEMTCFPCPSPPGPINRVVQTLFPQMNSLNAQTVEFSCHRNAGWYGVQHHEDADFLACRYQLLRHLIGDNTAT